MNYYTQVSFNLKVLLFEVKIAQNAIAEPFYLIKEKVHGSCNLKLINDLTLQTKKQRLEIIDRLIFINHVDRQVVSMYFAQLLNACVE